MIGCASQTSSKEPSEAYEQSENTVSELELALPEDGIQIEIQGNIIEPGDDIEWCEVVRLPGNPEKSYYINRIESAMTPQGHNLHVSAAIPGTETEANMDVDTRVTCQRAGEVFGEELVHLLESQHLYEDIQFPEGIGKILHGGQKVVINYHYFNTTEEPIKAKVKVNFHLVDEMAIERIAHSTLFNNLTIYTPPRGSSSHLAECLFNQKVHIFSLSRQTHRSGTNFSVYFAGGERDGQHIWTSSDWEDDTRFQFSNGPVLLNADEGFRFKCDYQNNTDQALGFGANATDEVCILRVDWWVTKESEKADKQECLLFNIDEDGVARKYPSS